LFQDGEERGRVTHPHLSDPALQFAALDQRTIEALRAGRAPLWNPDLYGGAPLLGDAQSRPLSPVTLLRVLLPKFPGMAQDLGVAWLFTWLSVGVALLTRRLFDCGITPIITASAVAVTTPYLSVWMLHPHASTFVWLPWCLYALECGSFPLMAFVTAGLCTGGHPGTLAHVGGISAAWWLFRSRSWRTVLGACSGILLAAPIWMPFWEQVGRSTTMTARVGGTLEPTLLLDLVWPGWWGHPATETWTGQGAWADGQLHPGLAAMLFGLMGLLGLRASNHRGLLLGVTAGMLLATVASVLGLPGPIAHGRLASVVAVGWCLPTAYGAMAGTRRWPQVWWLLPLMILATGTAARWSDQHTRPGSDHAPEPASWVSAIQAAAHEGRVLGVDWAAQPNTAALAGLRDLRGYDLPVSTDTHRLMTALSPRPRGPWYPVDTLPPAPLLEWWNVRVVLAFPDQFEATAHWAETSGWEPLELSDAAPLHAWRNPTPGPSAWLAGTTVPLRTPDQALRWLTRAGRSRHILPVEPDGPRLESDQTEPGPVTRRWDGASKMELSWEPLEHDALLVVAESWAPGWRARLADGSTGRPIRVGGNALGLSIPSGHAGATLYYRPDGWIRGQQLFAVGCILLLVGVGASRKHRHSAPPRHLPQA